MEHGRYDYHPWSTRPRWEWPNGTKLAVYLGLNLEHFRFGEGLGAELAPGASAGMPQPDVLNYAWRDYGNRVGAWRVIEMLDELALPCTVLANSAMYDYAPELMAAHRARGDEVAGHGRTNAERQGGMEEDAERALIREATTTIARHEGTAPRGWLSPWISETHRTSDLLREEGYRYTLNWCSDDQPVWHRTRAGRLLAVPYGQEVNDIPAIVARKDGARPFAEMIADDFAERLRQVRDGRAQVMGIALHPYLIGQPYRLRALRGALEGIVARRSEVWLCTAGAIFDHVLSLPEGVIPADRR